VFNKCKCSEYKGLNWGVPFVRLGAWGLKSAGTEA